MSAGEPGQERGRGDAGDRAPARSTPLGLEELVGAALAEDVGDGDRTTRWTVPEDARGTARIVVREDGVVAGTEPAGAAFRHADPDLEVGWRVGAGDRVARGEVLARVTGRLRPLLVAERTALNFLSRLSGIATLTDRYVAEVAGTGCRITDTRKTTPGWRVLEKRATAAGGAVNHRMGLYDMVLIKENHVRAAGGVGPALETVRGPARREGLTVEVEVTCLEELEEALAHAPDRILLDNMRPDRLATAVRRVGRHEREGAGSAPVLEASGGVGLETVREVAETGVDLVSVGALTHSAPALDVSLLVEEA